MMTPASMGQHSILLISGSKHEGRVCGLGAPTLWVETWKE